MIISMTGFSSLNLDLPLISSSESSISKPSINTSDSIRLTLALKTLNSRFFEANCKLPFELANLESDFVKYLKSQLIRGTVYFSIYVPGNRITNIEIEPSLTLIKNYLQAIQEIKDNISSQDLVIDKISLSDILKLPNVFQEKESLLNQASIDLIKNGFFKLVDLLKAARTAEGNVLLNDLLKRIDLLANFIAEIEPRASLVVELKKESLTQTIRLLQSQQTQNSVIGSEIQMLALATQLDKAGITEEIVRFNNHLLNLTELIKNTDIEKGKKIDFILQELLREINTIASKSNDSIISNLVINIKIELERIKEQAQNII